MLFLISVNVIFTETAGGFMSVVIVGGNERMENQYESICKSFGYKAKIFTKESGAIKKKIGSPDLMILFTNTVSHKMVLSASQEAKKNNIPIACCHSSSATALSSLLSERRAAQSAL